jgi:hypothetical protein
MKIAITEVSDAKEGLIALGLKALLVSAGMEAPSVSTAGVFSAALAQADHVPAPPALPAPAAAPAKGKYKARGVTKPAAKKAPKRTPAPTAPTDSRGTRRDAIRAALAKGPAPIEIMTARAQATFPEMTRTDVGTVLCQLSKTGECELGDDRNWRASR